MCRKQSRRDLNGASLHSWAGAPDLAAAPARAEARQAPRELASGAQGPSNPILLLSS